MNQCMEENVLRDFLAQHGEVMHVMTFLQIAAAWAAK